MKQRLIKVLCLVYGFIFYFIDTDMYTESSLWHVMWLIIFDGIRLKIAVEDNKGGMKFSCLKTSVLRASVVYVIGVLMRIFLSG